VGHTANRPAVAHHIVGRERPAGHRIEASARIGVGHTVVSAAHTVERVDRIAESGRLTGERAGHRLVHPVQERRCLVGHTVRIEVPADHTEVRLERQNPVRLPGQRRKALQSRWKWTRNWKPPNRR
jgi:hypothetical protein